MKNRIISTSLVLAGFLLGATALSALAQTWTAPTQSPPGGNVAAPINAGATQQNKTGLLGLANLVVTNLNIASGTPGVGQVLTSDASGNAAWQAAPSGGGLLYTTTGGVPGQQKTNSGGDETISGSGIDLYSIAMDNPNYAPANYVIGRIGGSDYSGCGSAFYSYWTDFTYTKSDNDLSYLLEMNVSGTNFSGDATVQKGTAYTGNYTDNETELPSFIQETVGSCDVDVGAYYNTSTNTLLLAYYPKNFYSSIGMFANVFN